MVTAEEHNLRDVEEALVEVPDHRKALLPLADAFDICLFAQAQTGIDPAAVGLTPKQLVVEDLRPVVMTHDLAALLLEIRAAGRKNAATGNLVTVKVIQVPDLEIAAGRQNYATKIAQLQQIAKGQTTQIEQLGMLREVSFQTCLMVSGEKVPLGFPSEFTQRLQSRNGRIQFSLQLKYAVGVSVEAGDGVEIYNIPTQEYNIWLDTWDDLECERPRLRVMIREVCIRDV